MGARLTGARDSGRPVRVVHEGLHRIGHRGRRTGLDEQPGFAVLDRFEMTHGRGGHDRPAHQLGFDHCVAERLAQRGREDGMRSVQRRRHR